MSWWRTLDSMSSWILAGLAVVGIAGWMAVTIRSAPLGIEDEAGFQLVGPDGAKTGLADSGSTERFYWPTATVLLMPF